MVLRLKAFNNSAQDNAQGNEGKKFVLPHDYPLDTVQLMFGAKIEAFLEEFPLRLKMGFVPFRM